MPQIITSSKFNIANELNIPLAADFISDNPSLQTPSAKAFLDNLCIKLEKELLINALGLVQYNALQLAFPDIEEPENAKYKKLVQGDEYDGKIWIGLDSDYSPIAWLVLQQFLIAQSQQLTGVGVVNVQPEAAQLVSPKHRIAIANAEFVKMYQLGYMDEPYVSSDGLFVDWFGCNNNSAYVSLWQYLVDKQADFSIEYFKPYETYNSAGI